MIVYTSLFTRGIGWHVYDVDGRRKVAGPFKGLGAREKCLSEELRIRREAIEARTKTETKQRGD